MGIANGFRARLVWIVAALVLVGVICVRPARAELAADQLLLIVNKNEPQGKDLAAFYSLARHVPADRICEVDLPVADQIPFETYELRVLPFVRDFLRKRNLDQKVTCLVTFYGMPLRLQNRSASVEEKAEVQRDNFELETLRGRLLATVEKLEKAVVAADPTFQIRFVGGTGMANIELRYRLARQAAQRTLATLSDPKQRSTLADAISAARGVFEGPASHLLDKASTQGGSRAPTTAAAQGLDDVAALAALLRDYYDPSARQRARIMVRNGTPVQYGALLEGQVNCLATLDTSSALDSELSLLWATQYPRAHFLINPLYARDPGMHSPQPVMTCRLDAPKPDQVRQMILASLKAERDGLSGRVVIDARGLHPRDANGKIDNYYPYDQTLYRLDTLVTSKTKLDVYFDTSPGVIPAHSEKGVAVYCGWYSPGEYIPSCEFVPGAVGLHVASYEMTSLHDPNNRGWCRGMINDGVAATIGPVAEPYLLAFPQADEFFPLLMTGKLTLAEVYWRTTPTMSWMMDLVGDPLYRPFMKNSPVRVEDLPPHCRTALVE